MSEMYLTADSVEQAEAYYRTQMAYNGWVAKDIGVDPAQSLGQVLGPKAAQLKTRTLAFQNDRGMCGVVIVESPEQPLTGSSAAEHTIIMVNYLESDFLKGSARSWSPEQLLQGPPR